MNSWQALIPYTQARIGLGQAGPSLPTRVQLELQKAQALARDALWKVWNPEPMKAQIESLGAPVHILKTCLSDRRRYLYRPDLGRLLDPYAEQLLSEAHFQSELQRVADTSIIFCISDGLSAEAVDRHLLPLLGELLPRLKRERFSSALPFPFFLIPFARVAVADGVGEILRSRMSVIFVGERPGLSAQDSLGIYLTHTPRLGTLDSARNCISNIRPGPGLSYAAASEQLCFLLRESLRLGISGTDLKGPDLGELLPESSERGLSSGDT